MNELTPPRLEEGFQPAPTQREDAFGDTIEKMSSKAFADAWQKLSTAGTLKVEADDPRIFTAYKQANKYIADMASAGMSTLEGIGGAVAGAIGEAFGGSPEGEVRLARDIMGMTEAFAGSGIARGANLMDDLIESGVGVAAGLARKSLQKPTATPPTKPKEDFDILFDQDFEGFDEDFIPVGKSRLKVQEAPFIDSTQDNIDNAYALIKEDIQLSFESSPEGSLMQDVYGPKLKILNNLKKEELLGLAKDIPHPNAAQFQEYVDNVIAPISKYIGVEKSDFLGLLGEFKPYLPKKEDPAMANLAEAKLPYKSPIGLRAAENAPPRASDTRAEKVGFKDTVYHTSTAPEEFTEFNLGRGFLEGSSRQAQDLLGVHVGTARAAAERNYQAVRSSDSPTGFTMELRARTDKPATKKDLAKLLGKKPEDVFYDAAGELSEADLSKFIYAYSDKLFDARNNILPENSKELTAVALRRELAKEGYTHIPYLNDVEDPGSTSFIMLVDRPKDSPAVLRDVNAQFNPEKLTDPDLRFAEGGMVEDSQMNRLFQEGGMADDGMNREPQTGNKVPPGSLASEVRDDIPAKLSEGEYVVPADVVRFFGVKFFEDLRNQAKEGLTEMDADGRIGGTPAAPEEDEELSPEEEQMLREALGGMNMAEGGVVPAPFDRTQFKVNPAAGGFQSIRYINPKTKEERVFQFLNGMPLGIIPEGFVQATAEAAKVEEPKPSAGAPSVEGAGGEGKDIADAAASKDSKGGYAEWAETNRDAIMNDPLGFGTSAIAGATNKGTDFLGGLLGAVAPGLGVIGDLSKMSGPLSDAKAALSVAESMGLKGTPEYDKLAKDIENLTGTLSSTFSKAGVLGGVLATGKEKLEALTNPFSTRKLSSAVEAGSFSPKDYVSHYESKHQGGEGYFGSAEYSKDLASTAASYEAASKGDKSAIGPDYDPYSDPSIWNKGGLVTRPKTKKAKAKSKGLGGKQ